MRILLQRCAVLFGAVEDASGLVFLSPSIHHRANSPRFFSYRESPHPCWAQCSYQQHQGSNLGYPSVKTTKLNWLTVVPTAVIKQVIGLQTSLRGAMISWWDRIPGREGSLVLSFLGPLPPQDMKPSMTSYRTLLGGPQKHGSDLTCLDVKGRSSLILRVCCKQVAFASWPTKRALFACCLPSHPLLQKPGPCFPTAILCQVLGEGRTGPYL